MLEYLLGTVSAGRVRDTVRVPDVDLHVPSLCDVEIVSGLRGAMIRRALTEVRAVEALADYLNLPLTRHGHASLVRRVLELRANFSAYDATYIALAEGVGGELLTADDRLARAVEAHTDVPLVR